MASRSQRNHAPAQNPHLEVEVLPPGEGQTPEFIGSQGESHCGTRRLEHLGEVFVKQLLVKFVMGQDRVCA